MSATHGQQDRETKVKRADSASGLASGKDHTATQTTTTSQEDRMRETRNTGQVTCCRDRPDETKKICSRGLLERQGRSPKGLKKTDRQIDQVRFINRERWTPGVEWDTELDASKRHTQAVAHKRNVQLMSFDKQKRQLT